MPALPLYSEYLCSQLTLPSFALQALRVKGRGVQRRSREVSGEGSKNVIRVPLRRCSARLHDPSD